MSWTSSKDQPLPEARADDLLTEQVDDETVIYDLASKQVHCLSPLAVAVFDHCDGRTTPAECAIIAEVTVDEVLEAVAQLQERGLLETPALVIHDGLSRRQLMRRSAMAGAAAFAAPLITSIAAPTAAMAITGIPSGCSGCGTNSDCVSNHCCQSVPGKSCNQTCCVQDNNSCHFTNCVPAGCDVKGPGPPPPSCICDCTVPLVGCGGVVCPPGSDKCCTPA